MRTISCGNIEIRDTLRLVKIGRSIDKMIRLSQTLSAPQPKQKPYRIAPRKQQPNSGVPTTPQSADPYRIMPPKRKPEPRFPSTHYDPEKLIPKPESDPTATRMSPVNYKSPQSSPGMHDEFSKIYEELGQTPEQPTPEAVGSNEPGDKSLVLDSIHRIVSDTEQLLQSSDPQNPQTSRKLTDSYTKLKSFLQHVEGQFNDDFGDTINELLMNLDSQHPQSPEEIGQVLTVVREKLEQMDNPAALSAPSTPMPSAKPSGGFMDRLKGLNPFGNKNVAKSYGQIKTSSTGDWMWELK